jgi:CRP-like cAMP-binding protein
VNHPIRPVRKNGKNATDSVVAELEKKIRGFQLSSVFKDFSEDSLRGIAGAARFRHYSKGEYVVNEGDPPSVFRLMYEGRVKYFKEAASGAHFIVNVGHPGDAINSSGLIAGWPHISSVQAIDDATILWTSREDFLTFLTQYPSALFRIIDILHRVIASAHDRLIDMAGEKAEQRVCNVLFMLYGKFGSELRFTTSEIAELSGLTTETAIRVMTRLKSLRIICSERGVIHVLADSLLKSISRGPFLI